MQSVFELPDDVSLPPIHELVVGKPARWQGMPVEWSSQADPVPVYIARFAVPEGSAEAGDVYLFGARHELSEALVGGESFGEGNFVEFFVATEASGGGWRLQRLLQQESVTYSESEEEGDYVFVEEISDPAALSIHEPPAWDATEADWPTYRGRPMRFIGQVALPETDLTRTLLTWGITVYLFGARANGHTSFKIVRQKTEAQSAKQHYADEERRWSG